MKKFYFFAALVAGTALTSCTSEDDLALSPPEVNVEDSYAPIVFSSVKNNITRGDITGKDAADLLNNKFVVFGYKGTTTGTPGNTVFDNYLVEYTENTAHKTESNSSNWEYVDKTPIYWATQNGITKQTIKYWDYSKTQYDFIAWSTGSKTAIYEKPSTGIPSGQVYVSAITPQTATSPATGLGQAYTFEGEAEDLKECYIADIMTIYKGNVPGTAPFYNVVANGYQQPVTLKFRQLGTKVRIGIYETVPGYSVKKVQFYSAAAVDTVKTGDAIPESNPAATYTEAQAIAENASAKIFTTVANGIYKEGKYTVTFPTVDDPTNADNNQAHIDFEAKSGADQKTTVDWGALTYTFRESGESSEDAIYLGRSSNTASFAGNADANYYVVYLPNQNGTNLNLRVNFTLESIDGSGEEIVVKGATAQVPSIYTAWKPGYAYTYLFKISDKTNGYTGVYDPTKPDDTSVNSDPAGLYPITFDAVVVNAEEDATQETITTISTPSITTYQNGSNVVNNNEYTVLTSTDPKINGHIYVTVNDADAATLTGKAALYTIPAGKTEAEVVDALALQDENAEGAAAGTITGRSGLVLTPATAVAAAADIDEAGEYALTNEVQYGADGNTISVAADQALRFQPAASTTYAFVYTKQAASTPAAPIYQPVTLAEGATIGANVYRYALTNAPTTPSTDVQKDVTYFAKNDGTEGAITAFLGQDVSNLYLDANGAQQATGYAKSSGTYYYTDNNGLSYKQAANINYADFESATDLYTFDGTDYTAKTDVSPAPGTAYYQKTSAAGVDTYTYCVILPQQTTSLYVIDDDENNIVAASGNAVKGMIYLDRYTQNNGVYYVKVIKVQ